MKIENAMRFGNEYKGDLSFYTIERYFKQLKRLFTKHQRISIWSCNGTKIVNPKSTDYDRPDYHYTDDQFQTDIEPVEQKINRIITLLGKGFTVEYQGDPRGYTCKLYYRASKRDGEHKEYKGVFIDLEQGE